MLRCPHFRGKRQACIDEAEVETRSFSLVDGGIVQGTHRDHSGGLVSHVKCPSSDRQAAEICVRTAKAQLGIVFESRFKNWRRECHCEAQNGDTVAIFKVATLRKSMGLPLTTH
jgi:hypothetical protein